MRRRCTVVCWGPIESLANGYFVRMYSLVELLSKICGEVFVIEYVESIRSSQEFYKFTISRIDDSIKLLKVKGNEKQIPRAVKYLRFMLWQIINAVKLRSLLKSDLTVFAGELFAPSLIVMKILRGKGLAVADPQMLLSEREQRSGRALLSKLLAILEKIFFLYSDIVIALSDDMKSKICNLVHCERKEKSIIIVPHVLPKPLRTVIHCSEKLRSEKPTLVFVGDITAQHNYDSAILLIKIMKYVDMKLSVSVKSRVNLKPVLKIVGRIDEVRRRSLLNLVEKLKLHNVSVEVVGYVDDLDKYVCEEADILLAPMFSMSGVSTKMLYYLKFKDKKILASKQAIEGIEHLIRGRNNVLIASNVKEFTSKLYDLLVGQ